MASRIVGFKISGVFNRNNGRQVAFITPCTPEEKEIFRLRTGLHPLECLKPRSGSIDASTEPFRSKEKFSSYAFTLIASDEVGSLLFQRSSVATGELPEPLDSTTTTNVNLGVSGLAAGSFDEDGNFEYPVVFNNFTGYVYIGRELIYIRQDNGSGTYGQAIRGAAGTVAENHPAGTRFYIYPSYWVGRSAQIFDYDVVENHLEQRENGVVSQGFTMSHATIRVQISSRLRDIKDQTVNNAPTIIPNQFLRVDLRDGQTLTDEQFYEQTQTILGSINPTIYPSSVKKPGYGNADSDRYFQFGDTFKRLSNRDQFPPVWYPQRYLGAPPISEETGRVAAGAGSQLIMPEGIEIFVIPGRDSGGGCATDLFSQLSTTVTDRYPLLTHDEVVAIYKRHPLAICAALQLSSPSDVVDADSFDILNGNWGLNLRAQFSPDSISNIHDLIHDTQNLSVDYLLLGWDASPIQLMREIRNILQTYGFRISIDNNGFFDYTRIGIPGVAEFDAALSTSLVAKPGSVLEYDDGASDRVTTITGVYGGLPWRKAQPFIIDSRGERDLPDAALSEIGEVQINANTVLYLDSLFDIMVTRSAIQDFQIPRLKLRVEDHLVQGNNYALGQYINLSDIPLRFAWLFNNQGERISDLPPERFTGQIMGRRYLPMEGVYELEIFFGSDFVSKWRAPSLVVEEAQYNSGTNALTLFQSVETNFGDGVRDSDRFSVGDVVRFYYPDGTPWVQNQDSIIISISPTTIQLKGITTEPDPGTIMELSHYKSTGSTGYSNPGLDGQFNNISNPYVFLADQTGFLGTDNVPGDKYGG